MVPAVKRDREGYAVKKNTTEVAPQFEVWDDPLLAEIRPAVREAIEKALEQELIQALGARWYGRTESRAGHRNGTVVREIGTPMGSSIVEVPRARVFGPDGAETEWRSTKLRRHARRMQGIDQAVVAIYLSGTNQRRVKAALRPLLKGLPLSKSTVSRLVARLREAREVWMSRDLSEDKIVYTYLDGFGVNVRRDGRVVRNPVLMAIGVRETGEKVLLSLRLAGGESTAAWKAFVEDLASRGLKTPLLAILDGSPALRAAVQALWPEALVQRCTVHKLRNLLAHAPRHAHEAVKEDFHRIVYASSPSEAARAYDRFLRRWRQRCPAVAESLEEAGGELLTFTRFPKEQWKSLRTTNIIERVNGEFRRRVKTQAALPGDEAVLSVLYGLVASGMVAFRRIPGWRTIPAARRAIAAVAA
jgi:putative transposase